jgi:hypothetical protein
MLAPKDMPGGPFFASLENALKAIGWPLGRSRDEPDTWVADKGDLHLVLTEHPHTSASVAETEVLGPCVKLDSLETAFRLTDPPSKRVGGWSRTTLPPTTTTRP